MDISTIERFMERWQQYTFREGVMYASMPVQEREKCLWVCEGLDLLDKKMIGYSVQNLPNIDEGFAGGIYFTEVFEKWANGKYLTPVSFIRLLIKEYEETGLPFDVSVIGAVGRGFRGLPSFIREIDLADKLQKYLPESKCYRVTSYEDMKFHTDVHLEYKGNLYHVFSYQNTGQGLEHMVSKTLGERGDIVSGYCLLCPFDYKSRVYAKDLYGWRLHNERYLEKVKNVLDENQPIQYNDLYKKSRFFIRNIVKDICLIYK